MSKIKKLFHLIPLLLAWLVLSVIFWGWIFTIVTNIPPGQRIVIAVDAKVNDPKGIAVELEQTRPDMIRQVRVLPFTYAVMSTAELEKADLFVISERDMEELEEWFLPLTEKYIALQPAKQERYNGFGILMEKTPYDSNVLYENNKDGSEMHYYLCLGNKGGHIQDDGQVDRAVDYYLTLLLGTIK